MTAEPVPPANPEDSPPASASSRRGTLLVTGAVLYLLLILLYMERIPGFLHWPVRILFAVAVIWLAFVIFKKIRATKFEAKKVVFSLVLLAFLYGALFLICTVFIKLMSARDDRLTTVKTNTLSEKARRGVNAILSGDSPSLYDKEVGWVPRPGYAWKMHQISEQGVRGTRIYPETPPDPEKRFLCIGDSFTFGYEVEDDQTFPSHAEQMLPGTEWVNLGICGGGLTQALMHYRKNGRKFGGNTVVIGFMTNNNKRTVNCYRGFVSPDDPMTPLTKPYAKLTDGNFRFEPNPYQDVSEYEKLLADEAVELQKLAKMDYLTWSNQQAATNPVIRTLLYISERRYVDENIDLLLNLKKDEPYGKFRSSDDPYGRALWHPESPGFQANMQVFDIYYNEVIEDGRKPLIVIFPSAKDVEQRSEGRPPKHAALLAHLEEKGYHYFDFLDSLEAKYGDKLSAKDLYGKTHLNGDANKFLAEEVIKALELR